MLWDIKISACVCAPPCGAELGCLQEAPRNCGAFRRLMLFAELEFFEDRAVAGVCRAFQVVEKTPALCNEFEKTATGCVVFFIGL